MPDLSIIILTYNNSRQITILLESIFKFYMKELTSGKLELLVIDNQSQDDTVKIAREYLQKHNIYKLATIHVSSNPENVGFGAGLNLGMQQTKAPQVVFINPDAQVADNHLFDMKKLFEENKIGIVGGKIINSNGKVELSAGKFLNVWSFIKTNFGMERLGGGGVRFSPSKFQKVDFVSGGFMMVSRAKFDEIGGFDKHIFMYMEDMELCFRARQHGYDTYFYPDAVIQHDKHGSSNKTFAIVQIYRGTLYFFKTHRSKLSYFLVQFLLRLKAVLLIALGFMTRNSYLTKTYEEAIRVC
jgi:GT2 family glycosyltransferase